MKIQKFYYLEKPSKILKFHLLKQKQFTSHQETQHSKALQNCGLIVILFFIYPDNSKQKSSYQNNHAYKQIHYIFEKIIIHKLKNQYIIHQFSYTHLYSKTLHIYQDYHHQLIIVHVYEETNTTLLLLLYDLYFHQIYVLLVMILSSIVEQDCHCHLRLIVVNQVTTKVQ